MTLSSDAAELLLHLHCPLISENRTLALGAEVYSAKWHKNYNFCNIEIREFLAVYKGECRQDKEEADVEGSSADCGRRSAQKQEGTFG